MAVKATAQITLAVGVDVSSVDNYYKLQASSATPPTKPTTANPTGWSTTEPAYDGTTTNTLYICTKTTLTDNTFYWSAVSVSSSYEAAKQAANAANAARTSVDNLATYVDVVDARAQAALSQTTSDTGESVTTTNAASAPLRSLAVYGKSVQDGTPTQSAPVAVYSVDDNLLREPLAYGGVYDSANSSDDAVYLYGGSTLGTITRSGDAWRLTASSGSPGIVIPIREQLNPGESITFEMDYRASSGIKGTFYMLCSPTPNVSVSGFPSFTRDEQWHHYTHEFTVPNYSAKKSVGWMVFYGASTAGSWAEVKNVKLKRGVAASIHGKNLLDKSNWDTKAAVSDSGITMTFNSDGSVTLDGTFSGTSSKDYEIANISGSLAGRMLGAGTYVLSGCPNVTGLRLSLRTWRGWAAAYQYLNDWAGASTSVTVPDGSFMWPNRLYANVDVGTVLDNVTFYPQLERGSTATAYEPYHGTTTPIDLQGHQLRSLPDGTKDELHVVNGRKELTKRVGAVDLGSLTWYHYTNFGRNNWQTTVSDMKAAPPEDTSIRCMSSGYPAVGNQSIVYMPDASCIWTYADNNRLVVHDEDVAATATVDEFKAIVTGMTVLYPLATPQTIDLGTITMPMIEDGDTVEIVGSSVVPTITAEWALPLGYVTSIAEQTQAHFWADTAGAHVGTTEGLAHKANAGYNMTLGATNSNVGIVLEHNADILASFTKMALQFYANRLLSASYSSNGALLYATVNALAAVVAAFTASGVSFYDGNGTNDNNILAAFTNSGTQIGKKTDTHVVIDNDSFDILDELDRLLTHIDRNGWWRYNPVDQYPNGDDTKPQNPGYDPDNPSTNESYIGLHELGLENISDDMIFGDLYPRYYWDSRAGTSGEWAPVRARTVRFKVLSPNRSILALSVEASVSYQTPVITLDSFYGLFLTPGADGNVHIGGNVLLDGQNYTLRGLDTDGVTEIPLIHINSNGNIIVGNNTNTGQTRIYGNNVDIVSDGKFRMDTSPPVVVEYKDITVSSTNAQTNFLTSVSVSKSGYTPTAIAGKYFTSGTRQNFLNDWGTHLEGNTLYVRLCNVHASQSASGTYRVQIEYHRNEML